MLFGLLVALLFVPWPIVLIGLVVWIGFLIMTRGQNTKVNNRGQSQ
jgi:hypothetical protein